MQLIRCSIDGERPKEKPATLFWSWRDRDGTRQAYRQRLCLTHYAMNVVGLLGHSDDDRLHCPACGIDTEDSYIPVYATIYPTGHGRQDEALPLCEPCALRVKTNAELGSERLPDREVGAGDAAPTYSANETLKALGRDTHV